MIRVGGDVPKDTFDICLKAEKAAEEIYRVITSKRFSRGPPTNPHKIIETMAYFFSERIHYRDCYFSVLWGGSKESNDNLADDVDIVALDNLVSLKDKINSLLDNSNFKVDIEVLKDSERVPSTRELTSKLEIELIFCDLHHYIANRRKFNDIGIYYRSLKKLTEERKFSIKILSDFYKWDGYHMWCGTKADDYIGDLESRIKARELIVNNAEVMPLIEEAAKKHSLWIKEKISPKDIGKVYIQMEIDFLKKLNEEFARIFISYSDPRIQSPIAEAAGVPMLYFHSLGQGHHECPWYVSHK